MPTKDTHIIDVRTKGAKKSEKQIKGVGGALGGMAKQAGIAAAAYFGTTALLSGIKQSIDLFAKQELAEKKLRFAAGSSTQELIKQAQALQKNTRFGDEAIIAQQAYVASLGISTEQTKEIIEASVDLAAAMGISLESAVRNTTKTLSGMQGELGEALPAAFKNLTAEQLKAGEGIKFIREQFKGTAEEETQTLIGSLDQMSNAVGDAGEALGETLAPMIIASANAVKFMAEAFQSLFNWQDKYKHLALETNGILSDTDAAFLMMQQNIENQTKRTEVLSDMQETFNKINESSNLTLGEQVDLQDQFTDKQIATMIASGELNDVVTYLRDTNNELAETLVSLIKQYELLPETQLIVTDAQELYNIQQLKALETTKKQKDMTDEFIKLYPKEAKALGLTTEELKKKQKVMNVLGKISKGDAMASGRVSQLSAIINTAEAVTEFLAKGSWGQALLAAAMGAKEVNTIEDSISKFATGANFITDGPTAMIVGDNPSGEELVQVTPLGGDPNIEGPQGGGITLNIQGSVIGTEEFVEDVLLEQIKEGLRLGGDIGIN